MKNNIVNKLRFLDLNVLADKLDKLSLIVDIKKLDLKDLVQKSIKGLELEKAGLMLSDIVLDSLVENYEEPIEVISRYMISEYIISNSIYKHITEVLKNKIVKKSDNHYVYVNHGDIYLGDIKIGVEEFSKNIYIYKNNKLVAVGKREENISYTGLICGIEIEEGILKLGELEVKIDGEYAKEYKYIECLKTVVQLINATYELEIKSKILELAEIVSERHYSYLEEEASGGDDASIAKNKLAYNILIAVSKNDKATLDNEIASCLKQKGCLDAIKIYKSKIKWRQQYEIK